MFLYTFSPACLTESSLLVYQFERSFFLHTLSIAVKNWWRHNRWYKGSSTCMEYSTRSDGARRSDGKKSQGKICFSMRKRLRVVGRSTASKEEEPELGRPWPGTYYLLTKNQMVRGLAPVLFGITHRISNPTPPPCFSFAMRTGVHLELEHCFQHGGRCAEKLFGINCSLTRFTQRVLGITRTNDTQITGYHPP